jgi:hypothetical protein
MRFVRESVSQSKFPLSGTDNAEGHEYQMKSSRVYIPALMFVSLCICRQIALGQAAADVALSTGSPTTIYHGTDLEQVDTNSGNLHISLPLLHLKGRGLDTDIALSYNSKVWASSYTPPPSPGSPASVVVNFGGGLSRGSFVGFNNGVVGGLGWSLGVPRMGVSGSGSDECEQSDASGNCLLTISHGSWIQSDGTQIQLVRSFDGTTFNPPNGEMASFDGSFSLFTSRGLIYKDGVAASMVLVNSVFHETLTDTNGNKLDCALTAKNSLASCIDTLGRAVTVVNDASWQLPQTLGYLDSDGVSRSVGFFYTTFNLTFPFGTASQFCSEATPSPVATPFLTSITLANGLSYQFQYVMNPDGSTTGEIAKIILPTGGYIRYVYGFGPISNDAGLQSCGSISMIAQNRMATSRIVSPDGTAVAEQTWSYAVTTPSQPIDGIASVVMTVKDPVGDSQTYARGISGSPLVHHIDYINPSGAIIKSVLGQVEQGTSSDPNQAPYFYFQAFNNPRYKSLTTILTDTSQQSRATFTYGSFNNVIEKDETDWGPSAPGAVLRKTTSTYLNDSNHSYESDTVHILDRVVIQSVCDAGSTFCAQTTASYDTGTLSGTTNISGHDYTNFPSANTLRGNPTQIARLLNTSGGNVVSTSTYNDVGNVLQFTDPNLNITSFSYTDNYANGSPAQPTSAFPTQITRPVTNSVSHIQRSKYYFNTGLTAATCGENFPSGTACASGLTGTRPDYQSMTFDPMGRPLVTTKGDGGQTTFTYNEASVPFNTGTSTKIDGTHNATETTVYDGLGRLSQTQLTSDPSGTTYQLTRYDSLGLKKQVFNPTRCNPPDTNCGEATWGYSSFIYDGLGRTTKVTSQDGGISSSTFSGNKITVTDQAGKQRQSVRTG